MSEAELWFKRAINLAPKQASVFHYYGKEIKISSNINIGNNGNKIL